MTEHEETRADATQGADDQNVEEPQTPDGAATGEAAGEDVHESRAERRYAATRARLKAVTAERDALVARVLAHQRADVERIASRHLADPGVIWSNGLTLEDVIDADSGQVDAEAAAAVVGAIADRLRGALPPPPHHGDLGPRRVVPSRSSASWPSLLRGR